MLETSFEGGENGQYLKLVNNDRRNDYCKSKNFCPYWRFRSVEQIQSSKMYDPYSMNHTVKINAF